jgi:CRISPR-associated endonuclease Csn1
MRKKILGLDLGTNSIGWALTEINGNAGFIINAGSRIIPMPQDILGKFDSGVSISQTAERTGFRSTRRLRERHLLRRERLHRVLHTLKFLPEHYAEKIDFKRRLGQYFPGTEPKIAYRYNEESKKATFIFQKSFEEMLEDFAKHQPQLLKEGKKIPYDWTIYYLRKKALTEKIENEELAWLLLHFNQKRGYYQLRSEEDEEIANKLVEFYTLKVIDVIDSGDRKGNDETWYNVHLENGWIYRRTSKVPLDWIGKSKEFIVTTDLNDDGSIKIDKEGKEKRTFRSPAENDWTLVKKKTEQEIEKRKETVGEYIYESLLLNPSQKIRGKLIRTIERKFYKDELKRILEIQQSLNPALQNREIYKACLEELYEYNENHKKIINEKDFVHLFLNDILFYQRPLKSKKSLISDCRFENRVFVKDGKKEIQSLKCIAKSHPLFQEFRLWKFLQGLRIYQREKEIDGKLQTDIDVTVELINSNNKMTSLFEWLNDRKDVEQKPLLNWLLKPLKLKADDYRWNYVEDKTYPCNETRALILSRLAKVKNISDSFLTEEKTEALWHILYSVDDKIDIEKALNTFANKNNLAKEFVEVFKKFPPFKNEYGSYSAKAIKKLLPLMRIGKYWNVEKIYPETKDRINKIISGEFDKTIRDRVREKSKYLEAIDDFQGLPEWLATYIVYDRHSEAALTNKWNKVSDIKPLEQHSLRNPIVEKVINETLQVIKEIWKQYGNENQKFFDEIHIELGREMKNTKADREKISKQISENENTNLRIKALLMEMLNDTSYENVRPYSPMQQEILRIYEEGALNAELGKTPEEILKISKQAQPSFTDLTRYKLWLQQKYRSPYTGEIIPLNKLFTPHYEIEHIIPQSRYFDDSFSNKVICESIVNKLKDNQTGYEFISNFKGTIVTELSTPTKQVKIFNIEGYERFVKENYSKSRGKMKKLLMDDIPEAFIQRQLNDSRYISKIVKNLVSNIVREDNELETVSKNVISSNGTITSVLKQDWGLNDVWNEIITPRFERLNSLTNSNKFGEWVNKEGKRVFQTQVPLELQKGFNKKRIDHRHHALDAIIIACVTRDHINYLNNESALGNKTKEEKESRRYDLRHKLCFKKYNDDATVNYKWVFKKPWESFTQESKAMLKNIIVSFKQNQRIINKTVNKYQKWAKEQNGEIVKKYFKQDQKNNWAIRKPMHKDTVAGLVKLKFKKDSSLSVAIDNWSMIADKSLRNEVKKLVELGYDKKQITKYFKDNNFQLNNKDISKVEIFYWDLDKQGFAANAASRVKIDESFNESMIKCITDSGIQKIMFNHLKKYQEENNGKIIDHPELAFSVDGVDKLNNSIRELNDGKSHQNIYKVRTYEPRGNKFNIGQAGNKKDKYVEAAKGTNLFFAIYKGQNGKRNCETIPLNIVIERMKNGLSAVPEKNEMGESLLMELSPQDLVYIPTEDELINSGNISFSDAIKKKIDRIYKIVSFTGNRLSAIPYYVAAPIVDKIEFTQLNKLETSLDKLSIKENCIKLKIDRLGNIKKIFQ